MNWIYQALFSALILLAIFTLDSKGLTRVDHHGYRPANSTTEHKPWNPSQTQYGGGPIAAPTRNPYQGWGGGAQPSATNYSQWNRYNQTSPSGNFDHNQNNFNKTNQWQRYNNTPQAYPSNINQGIGGWSPQQTPRPFNTNNWQRQNQSSHLYPQLPQQNWQGGRTPVQATTTPPVVNNNQWGSYGRWNNTQPPVAGVGRPQNPNNNWWQNQTRTGWPTPQPSNTNYWKGQQNFPSGYIQNQTVGSNWWIRPNATNNYGWGSNTNTNGQNGWGGTPTVNGSQPGLAGWGGAGGGSGTGTGAGAGAGNTLPNNYPSNAQIGWQNNNNNGASSQYIPSNPNAPNNPNNWRNNNNVRTNGGDNRSNSGVPLSPLVGGSNNAHGQLASSSNNEVPLASIGDGHSSVPQSSWNFGNYAQNPWNGNSNTGTAQLAPLAPLTNDGNGALNPQVGRSG